MIRLLHHFATVSAVVLIVGVAAVNAQAQDSVQDGTDPVTPAHVVAPPVNAPGVSQHLYLTAPRQSTFPQDQLFIKEALEMSLMEAQVGQLAVQKASREDVRNFGQKLIEDRARMDELMNQAAFQLGVVAPEQLSKHDRVVLETLGGLSGSQFDQAFLHWMVRDHKHSLGDFRLEAQVGSTKVAQNVASQGAEMIYEHLQMIEHIARSGGSTAKLGE